MRSPPRRLGGRFRRSPRSRQKSSRRPHPGRQTLPAALDRQIEVVSCPPAQCTCGACGAETVVIGYEESEKLDVVPAKYTVVVTRREKRACGGGKKNGVMTAPAAPQIIEKCLAGNSLVVETVVAKYADHLPLYRQSAILRRDANVDISRVTMDGWVMRVGELLEPVARAMKREILQGDYLQADETPVDVQRRSEKKGKNHQAYLWQFGNPGGSVVFSFSLRRAAEVGQRFLSGYRGIVQTDAYKGYDWVHKQGLVHAGCWAPARRFFHQALKLNPQHERARNLVVVINELFAVDRQAREEGLSEVDRNRLRQDKARPVLDRIESALKAGQNVEPPGTQFSKRITYGLSNWHQLTRFLSYPQVELSNNLAENSMRPVALGRKNWLHVGSVAAGPRVSAILSVVETCRRLDIPVRRYLMAVLPGLADRPMSAVGTLTPAAWAAAQSV
jgi:transposase